MKGARSNGKQKTTTQVAEKLQIEREMVAQTNIDKFHQERPSPV
mgnify:FL=1